MNETELRKGITKRLIIIIFVVVIVTVISIISAIVFLSGIGGGG